MELKSNMEPNEVQNIVTRVLAWIDALRSGEFKQAKGCLENKDGNCCMGVGCRILPRLPEPPALAIGHNTINGRTTFDGEEGEMPDAAQEAYGLRDPCGCWEMSGVGKALTVVNDNGKSFAQIADKIESVPDGLFLREVADALRVAIAARKQVTA